MNEEPPGSGPRDPEPELPEEAGAHPPRPGEPPGFPPSPDPQPPDPGQPLGAGPPGPYGGQPPAYGQSGWYGYYPAQPQTEGMAIGALVAALLSIVFFFCAPVGAIVALVLASTAKKRIDASGGALTGLGLVTAARIIAVVELALIALGLLVTALLIASSVTTSPGSFNGSFG